MNGEREDFACEALCDGEFAIAVAEALIEPLLVDGQWVEDASLDGAVAESRLQPVTCFSAGEHANGVLVPDVASVG